MPELLVALQRNDRRKSKSLVRPSFQRINVFPAAAFSAVVSPWITPSFTDHSRGSPSQPLRSFPLKMRSIPAGSGGATGNSSAANAFNADEVNTTHIKLRIIVAPEKGKDR